MRTPQELLELSEKLLLRGEETEYNYEGYYAKTVYKWNGSHRAAFATQALAHIYLANALMQLEQVNFVDTLAKGLDNYDFTV